MLVTPEADTAAVNTILQMAGGAVLPRCLHAIANLGVADALGEVPETAASLAGKTNAHPEALARALRLLAGHGVFAETDGRFGHTSASRLLRSDHPQSLRPLARMFGLRTMWAMLAELEYSIRTGQPSGEYVFEGGPWAALARDPEANRLLDVEHQRQAADARGVCDALRADRIRVHAADRHACRRVDRRRCGAVAGNRSAGDRIVNCCFSHALTPCAATTLLTVLRCTST